MKATVCKQIRDVNKNGEQKRADIFNIMQTQLTKENMNK